MPHLTMADGVRLYYEETGRGTPIVFVHEYAARLPHLGAAASLLLPLLSLRHLQSARLSAIGCTRPIQRVTARILHAMTSCALMDALKIDKAHIVGHSMGA